MQIVYFKKVRNVKLYICNIQFSIFTKCYEPLMIWMINEFLNLNFIRSDRQHKDKFNFEFFFLNLAKFDVF